jgi:hypothetical protein
VPTGQEAVVAARQSSSEAPISLSSEFLVYKLDLDGHFEWGKNACHLNTAAVNRSAIQQVMFGHDSRVKSCEARFEIRNIRLKAR